MPEFITDRTQAHVIRCKALAAKGWNNMTDSEKAEWYGTAMRGAYNFSDLNRVEAAVAELSEFLGLGLTTKTNWGMWEYPDAAQMSRYISNLRTVKERYGAGVEIPAAMNGFTHESANNIEKMLREAYEMMGASEAWEKKPATVEYDWLYIRNDAAAAGQTGTDTQWSFYGGMMQATSALVFDTRTGFGKLDRDVALDGAAGQYVISDDRCVARQITSAFATGNTEQTLAGGTRYEIKYNYAIAGYATRTWNAYCNTEPHSYGYVLIPKGKLPGGTLIKGSYAEGYCYVKDGDNYYYYVRR